MIKIFTERTLVVILFVVALVVFTFASEDAHSVEARNVDALNRRASVAQPVSPVPRATDNSTAGPAAARD